MTHPTNRSIAIRASLLSIFGNALMAVLKAFVGIVGNSFALVADAVESATDVFSSTLVFLGLRYSTKPADEDHPYGHGRMEALVTFLVVGFLMASATWIAVEAVHNIRRPHEMPEPFTLYFLLLIVAGKEIFYRVIKKKGQQTGSSALKADAWHHRSDAITSAMAFIGISLALFLGEGYESADDYAALFASAFIYFNAYKIFRPALGEIMDEHQYPEMEQKIRALAMKVQGVLGTEKCRIRKTGMLYFVDLHLEVDGQMTVNKGHDISHEVKDILRNELPEIADVLIHIEPFHSK
jgi:cation diffusion facilitator family transporter